MGRLNGKRIRTLILAPLVAVNVLLAAWAIYSLHQSRIQVEGRIEAITQNMAQALDQSLTSTFRRTDLALLMVIDELERQLQTGRGLDAAAINRLIVPLTSRITELNGIRVTDAAGNVILGTGVGKETRASYRDRDFFPVLEHRTEKNLLVAKPVVGRVAAKWVIPCARRYNHADGSFAGVIVAAIDIEYITKLLSTLDFGAKSSAILRDADTGLIARYPPVAGPAGTIGDKSYSKEIAALFKAGIPIATYHTAKAADGIERTNSFRRLAIAPLTVIVGLASENYLADWHNEVKNVAALLGLFIFASALAGWLIRRLLAQQSIATVALQESNSRLAATLAELRERSEALQAAQEVGHLGTFTLNIVAGTWVGSPELDTIFGIGPDYAHDIAGWGRLVHPEDSHAMLAYLSDSIITARQPFDREYRIVRPNDGATRWVHGMGKLELNAAGEPIFLSGALQDISERKQAQTELDRIAHFDPLTGVPNRRLLQDRLNQALARSRRSGKTLAVCYLDLDGFKPVNDQFGHEAGDRLLVEISRRLNDVLRAGDTLARLGGDEFVLLFNDLDHTEECLRALDRILNSIGLPVLLEDQSPVTVSASIGVTLFPADGADSDTLLRHADQAMYLAKEAGKNRFHLWQGPSRIANG